MDTNKIAEMVFNKYQQKEEIESFIDEYPQLELEDAYQIQLMNVKKQLEDDDVVGLKIGLTAKAMQDKLNVDQPVFGHLFKSREIKTDSIDIDNFVYPKVESEIAFVLKEDLNTKDITQEDIIAATDYVVASFEIADSRVCNWDFTIQEMVCDNAAFGSYKLGNVKLSLDEIDLENEMATIYINDEEIACGQASNCLGSPLICLEWLVNALKDYDLYLKKGQIILTGALCGAIEVKKDDKVKAKFSSLGELELEFK